MEPFFKKQYWYAPAGNRLAMRESTPASSESNDTVTAITRYNYWKQAFSLADSGVAPATPSDDDAAYGSDEAKDQLLSEQRFDLSAASDLASQTLTIALVLGWWFGYDLAVHAQAGASACDRGV